MILNLFGIFVAEAVLCTFLCYCPNVKVKVTKHHFFSYKIRHEIAGN